MSQLSSETRLSAAVAGGGFDERRHGALVALQSPVLVVGSCMLGHVKPGHSQQVVSTDAPEEIGNLPRLVVRELADCSLRDQHGLSGEPADGLERIAED